MERRRRTALDLDLGRHLSHGYNRGPWWTPAEMALLGTAPDDVIAAKVGRAPEAVRCKRGKLGVANPRDRRSRG